MLGNLFNRRIQAAILWAMVPVAALGGQSVVGCISPDGHFDPTCQCWANQESSESDAQASADALCTCCGTSHCCCKNKSSTNSNATQQARTTYGPGWHVSGCRPLTAYFTVTAVNRSHRTVLVHSSIACIDQTFDVPAIALGIGAKYTSQLNTGPPVGNLTVALHRWVI